MNAIIDLPLLSILIWLPILGGCLVLLTRNDSCARCAKAIALFVALVSVLLCIPLWMGFNHQAYAVQFTELHQWIPGLNINYSLGVDGLSLLMVLLSAYITLVVVIAAISHVHDKVAQYLAAFLILQGAMVGVFAAQDAMLFYVFWEVTLIPIYLAIGVWGSSNRQYAAVKFFLYTFAGSALLFVGLLYLGMQANSFQITAMYGLSLSMKAQILLFVAFFAAFAVKIPMWPVHTWLPDAHTEAPAGGSVILAALMLKMGAYGFLRFTLPIVPVASFKLAPVMIALSLVAVIYIGLVAIVQKDMKRLIAYSSISHMGFVTLGCFMIFAIAEHSTSMQGVYMSMQGAIMQMISHGFSSGALFIGVGVLYERLHTRNISDFGGVAHVMPVFASLMMLFAMTNVGLPGTSGFVGEFMIILSAFKASFWISLLAATTVILAASYTLWMYKRVFFGEVAGERVAGLSAMTQAEFWSLGLLAAAVLFFGVYPKPLLTVLQPTVNYLSQVIMYVG